MKMRVLSLLLALAMLCTLLPQVALPVHAATDSGNCGAEGDNLTWSLDTETGLLTIEGSGAMEHYYWEGAPWCRYNRAITAIDLPEGLTNIGSYSFQFCDASTSVTIPDSVTSIGEFAFFCSSITSVTIGNSVTSIGRESFTGCSSLTSLTIPNSVTSIGSTAFSGCSSLTSLTIPNSVTTISNYAFSQCSSLTSLTIPDSVTTIGDEAFAYCESLTSVTIPDSVTSIGKNAFDHCTSLTSVTIPDSVTSIGEKAFGWYFHDFGDYGVMEHVSGFTIYGYEGTAAQIYAEENGFTFVSFANGLMITTQPQDVAAVAGSKVQFTVAASGDNLTYQWYSKVPDGNWVKSSFAGNKTATLTVAAAATRNGYQYRCEVKSGSQTVTSNAATLTVLAPLTITSQPQDVTAAAGSTAKFTVAASGDSLAYQWYSKVPGGNWVKSSFAGNKTATLTVAVAATRNGYQYRCEVKSGSQTVTSNAATLTVLAPLTITSQPQNVTAVAGSKVQFTVAASGDNLTYQWYSKVPGGDWVKSSFAGNKTATLTVAAAATRNGYQYRCEVKSGSQTVTSNAATLTVLAPLTITSQPQNVTAVAGSKVQFTVAASGDNLTYQWYSKVPGGNWVKSSFAGNKTATLTVAVAATRNGYQYRCEVKSGSQTVTSNAATLTVLAPLTITSQPQDVTAAAGSKVQFTVAASGDNLTYQWYSKVPGGNWVKSSFAGNKTATLTVAAAATRNGYQYRCEVKSGSQTVTSNAATLTVESAPEEPADGFIGKALGNYPTADACIRPNAFVDLIHTVQIWGAYDRTGSTDDTADDAPATLSIVAPLKFNGDNYLSEGDIFMEHINALYPENENRCVYQVEMTGDELYYWLVFAASKLKKNSSGNVYVPTGEINDYTVIMGEGFHYEIDMTKDKYQRIVNMTYNGQAITQSMKFTVVMDSFSFNNTNPYVVYVNNEGACDLDLEARLIYSTEGQSDGTLHALLVSYIKAQTAQNGGITPVVKSDWIIRNGNS